MGKVDDRGQLYEPHYLSSGEVIWLYSDKLHRLYSIADLNGLDLSNPSQFRAAQKIFEKKHKKFW